jgi:2-polyprenyl-3-methyl-5-hydroxy-6-metoxy-1,4-benzoquinol methylase
VNDSQLSVDELMRRVRQEVERRQLETRMHDTASPPRVDGDVAVSWQAMNEAITAAEPAAAVGMRLPPMTQMRGWRRRLAIPVARLILRLAQLVTREQAQFNQLVLDLLRMLTSSVHDRLASVYGKLDALTNGMAQAVAQTRAVPELVDAGARTASEIRALGERMAGLEDTAARLDAVVAAAVRRTDDAEAELAQARVERAALASSLEAERLRTQHAQTQVVLQERRIATLLEGLRAPAPATAAIAPPTVVDDARAHLFDAFYVSFEDHFRGTRDAIKARVGVYVPTIVDAGAGTAERPVLDLGCGRGELLEVLAENGLVARGVDLNHAMVLESRARGFDAIEGDALHYLRGIPEASLGAVIGLHVLEHVEFSTLVEIFDECVRVLQPGGVVIFETPNPKNLLVGACQFYIDPTHRTPLHPDTMAFVADSRGLTGVHIMPLHPVDDERRVPDVDSPAARILNEYLFGPQDFAVVAYRA